MLTINDFKVKNNKNILEVKEGDLPLLYFENIYNTGIVQHCFTTRLGGSSEGIFESLNLSFTRGDQEENVRENYKRVASSLGYKLEDIVTSDQTHTTNVRIVTNKDKGSGLVTERTYSDIDGLITNEPGILLATFYADCVPLYIVDPVNKAIGLSHSGWRGTVARMGKATIEAMHKAFGTEAKDCIVAIGPSICQDCYEVSYDVAEKFIEEFLGHPEVVQKSAAKADKYQLDLWRANELVFLDAGVKHKNIAITNICTCCNSDLLFSHRATQGKRGNLGAFMALK